MATYDTLSQYLAELEDNATRISRLKQARSLLEGQLIANAAGQELDSYEWDDGQSRIKTTIKDHSKILATINALDTIITRLENQSQGRVVKAVDAKSVTGL